MDTIKIIIIIIKGFEMHLYLIQVVYP